jgi:UDPglucose 6-dehydrogenase
MMKIAIIGTGYVGLVTASLANFDHEVNCIDLSKEKIDMINKGISPIYEPGLEEILKKNLEEGRLKATVDYEVIDDSDVVFICVGTPSNDDGSINLSQIKSASASIGKRLKESEKYKVVVVKSTVVPGTTKNVVIPILESNSGKKLGKDFGVCMNPEFLKEGSGVRDFLEPDKIVIGGYDKKSSSYLIDLYSSFNKKIPRILVDLSTAEMIKYAQNAALASRVSFINEIANICEKFSVDVNEVAQAIGLDKRIGPLFLKAGAGFGGSCFPKDVKALLAASRSAGIEPILIKSVLDVNDKQPLRMIELAKEVIGDFNNKTISVFGLSFKPNTDDMREAPSITIINSLLKNGAKVKVYDPQATDNAKKIFNDSVEYAPSKEDCVKNTDLCMIVTEWKEFKELVLSSINCPIIDGRRILNPEEVKRHNLIYKGIGWKNN